MRTVSRRARYNEKSTGLCDRCGSRWYRSDLWRDEEGLLNCPQEGRGRDAVALTKANVASARAYAREHSQPERYPGRLDRDTAEAISSVTGNFLFEDGTPMLFEDETYMALEG